jgi:hypothetical protein
MSAQGYRTANARPASAATRSNAAARVTRVAPAAAVDVCHDDPELHVTGELDLEVARPPMGAVAAVASAASGAAASVAS